MNFQDNTQDLHKNDDDDDDADILVPASFGWQFLLIKNVHFFVAGTVKAIVLCWMGSRTQSGPISRNISPYPGSWAKLIQQPVLAATKSVQAQASQHEGKGFCPSHHCRTFWSSVFSQMPQRTEILLWWQ